MTQYTHYILAFYHLAPLLQPHEEVTLHKAFLENRDMKCRLYISEEGINGQMSATKSAAQEYMDWMHSRSEFANLEFKLHEHHEHVFPRQTIKYRKQLVALDSSTDLSNRGEYLSPDQWEKLLESDQERFLLDVRNDYEWKIGHFKGAELPACEMFRDFRRYADTLKQKIDPESTPVMMYCTGGIRCEIYSAVLKEKGFKKVFQLAGGIINYGLHKGNAHWMGKLFVFDDRLALPLKEGDSTIISSCHHCHAANDTYYNCANMDCNALFLCCPTCLALHAGCCQESCKQGKRIRPYQEIDHKPFRKWYHYNKNMKDRKS